MLPIKPGSIVRITRQPPLAAHVVGQVGFVEEILPGEMVRITTIHPDGTGQGAGTIPASCLQATTDAAWQAAKEKHDARIAKIKSDSDEFGKRLYAKKSELSRVHGVPMEAVTHIHEEISKMWDDYRL